MYCDSLRGFYCLQDQGFEEALTTQIIPKYYELNKNLIFDETILAIFQYIFDFTFEDDAVFIYSYVVPILMEVLLANSFNLKLKVPVFLYLNHLIIHEKGFSNILLSMDFFLFHEYFLSSFMKNFNLESFKFFRKQLTKTKEMTQKLNDQKMESQKILKNVARNKGKTDNSQNMSEISGKNNEKNVNLVFYPMMIWDYEKNKFEKINQELPEETVGLIENEEKDQILGKSTRYFWWLHCLYHILRILQDFLKSYHSYSKDFIQKQFKDFVFQIIETTIIFNKYNEKFLPSEPFHLDTECWNEIRNILTEIMVNLFLFTILIFFKGNDATNFVKIDFKILIFLQYIF